MLSRIFQANIARKKSPRKHEAVGGRHAFAAVSDRALLLVCRPRKHGTHGTHLAPS
jgi:hypothetical protein